MVVYFFMVVSLFFYFFLLTIIYFSFKLNDGILNFQQSAYDQKRYIKFMGKNKSVFGPNELLPLVGLLVINYPGGLIFAPLIMIFFTTYNLRFLNLSKKRFDKKLGLKKTSRISRLRVVFYILWLIEFILFIAIVNYKYDLIIFWIISCFLMYVNILLASIIVLPIENMIKNYYKKKAVNKLRSMENVNVIGITGSFGKTSIKNIIGAVLSETEPTLITPESYNTPMGLTITINNYLTPLYTNFIAEMGAYYEGEIKELCDMVNPKIGIVSSVGPQHLETFKTIETITKTKMELVEALPENGLAILNYDNEYIKNYKIKNKVQVKWYSLENKDADIYGYDIKYKMGIMEFKVLVNENEYSISTKLLGRHNVENILAAILVALNKNISMEKIIKSIGLLKPIKNRLELQKVNSEFYVLNDAFNSNPVGIYEALNILNSFENMKKILITPGLIDLGVMMESFHEQLGEDLEKYCDEIYIVGSTNEKSIKIGLDRTNFNQKNYHKYDNFSEAYKMASKDVSPKVILIANDLPEKFN